MKKHQKKHQRTIEYLVKRLEESGRYGSIETNVMYSNTSENGEVDVLAFHTSSRTYHFYEVKISFSMRNLRKAQRQYERYCHAFPRIKIKGIFVSNGYACRLRL